MQLAPEHTTPRLARIRRCAVTAVALAAGMLVGCGDNLPAEPSGQPRPDARPDPELAMAATFEVHGTGALVSIYAAESSRARVRVEGADGVLVTDVGPVELSPARGRTGVAELAGLTPDTAYQYVVELERGSSVGPYRFRTAPSPDAVAEVHFVWSADVDLSADLESPIFAAMSVSGADFFVNLGDWPYADNAPAARTLEEYRVKHLAVRGAGKVQTALRALPVYAIYDDHEARNDWNAAHRVSEPERIAGAVAAWDEWFPLRVTLQGESRRWRSWRWGRHAEFFLLDTRCCRSANRDPDGPGKTMLGAEQKQWLIDALSASDAAFKVVFTSVSLFGKTNDDWSGFLYERDQLLDELGRRGISGLIALAGDGHLFAVRTLAERGLREFMAGPLARGSHPLLPAGPTLIYQYQGFNYGEVRISSGVDGVPQMEILCRAPDGTECYREVLRPDDLLLVAP
jgi:phosphodiesterase/alkaline phosphatase D-like protein